MTSYDYITISPLKSNESLLIKSWHLPETEISLKVEESSYRGLAMTDSSSEFCFFFFMNLFKFSLWLIMFSNSTYWLTCQQPLEKKIRTFLKLEISSSHSLLLHEESDRPDLWTRSIGPLKRIDSKEHKSNWFDTRVWITWQILVRCIQCSMALHSMVYLQLIHYKLLLCVK